MTRLVTAVCLCALALGCTGQSPMSATAPVEGLWHVQLEVPGGKLPFFLEVKPAADRLKATAVNGEERVETREVSFVESALAANFTAFNSKIEATLEDDQLIGTLSIVRAGGNIQMLPLTARRGVSARFPDLIDPPTVDVTGRWEVIFRQSDGTRTPAVGEFRQSGANLTGTFLTSTGDYRYLAGAVAGNRFKLSTFDGYHAFLFDATVDNMGVMRGDFWSGTHWHESWTAVRNDNAALPDANALTFLKPGAQEFNFAFPDTSGALVSLRDKQFVGKVVLVSIGGTWCPNCHDEAAFLTSLYRQHAADGLEVISLMYEHVEDFARAAAQVRAFAKRHNITWPVLIAGTSDRTEASKTLPMLNAVIAYPTTIFVDRNGSVRRIHTGFAGPGTGEHYRRLIREYTDSVNMLLAETAGSQKRAS